MIYGVLVLALWSAGWLLNAKLANGPANSSRLVTAAIPMIFGVTLLAVWELAVIGLKVPSVILPRPSAIWVAFTSNLPILWGDFTQTILKGALGGYGIGCFAAFATALLVDRFDYLQRGLLPIGNFMAALPIVGTAPILVMWFGFGWQSKAAVVVLMVYFPMLVNCVAGLGDTSSMQRDLMHTYAASWGQTLMKLRLPAALPFIFNGLKVCTTLALVGAIVAEFFGSPTKGLGFRITTAIGQLDLAMVWSAILVSALSGTAFYALMSWIEARLTGWHPARR